MLSICWTDTGWRVTALALVAGILAACGTADRLADAPRTANTAEDTVAELASPETEARYEVLLSRLHAGDVAATADLENFSAEHPGFAGPLLNLGLIRSRAGDEAGARVLFERAARVCSRCGPVWNELGVLHARHGRFTEAEAAYQRAIEVEPALAAAYYNLGIVYDLYLPRPDLALQNYEQYLQLAGNAGDGQDVEKWVADLRRRVNATPTAARTEGKP
jgi:Flp pilus assembly protein TadD